MILENLFSDHSNNIAKKRVDFLRPYKKAHDSRKLVTYLSHAINVSN